MSRSLSTEGSKKGGARWFLYLLECADGTLYTGVTTNVARRFQAHVCGKGARYTRAKGAVRVVYVESCRTKSTALSREACVKRLSRTKKLALVRGAPGGSGNIASALHEGAGRESH